jgi:hypothetical protein
MQFTFWEAARAISALVVSRPKNSMGIPETERNIANKISRDGFTAASFIQCLYPMSFGNRMFCAANRGCLIASLFLILASEGGAQGNPPSPATQLQQQQQQNAPTPAPAVKQPILDPDYYKISCDRPENHDAADLCEQRRMAQAAEDSVWWSAFQTKLAIGGTILVILSLIFTGWAAIAAGRAAKAAEASVAVASETARRQLRAYVGVGEPKFGVLLPTTLSLIAVNGGQTPAYRIRAHLNWHWIPAGSGFPDDFDFLDHHSPAETVTTIAALNPGKEIPFTFPFDPSAIARARDGETTLFFYGRVEYDDVFGAPHASRFFYQYAAVLMDGHHMGHAVTMQGTHNDAT